MLIPRILSTRVRAFRRTQGHNAVGGSAYRRGNRQIDAWGRSHDYSARDGVVGTRLFGWHVRPGESLDGAMNRLWVAAQEAEGMIKNRVEAREMRFDLFNEGGRRGERLRNAICRLVAHKVRRDTKVAGQISRHSEGEGGPGTHQHAHLMITDRRVDEHGAFALRKDTIWKDRYLGPAYVRELREYIAHLNTRACQKLGLNVRFSALSYTETYQMLNKERAREGLEPLEIPSDGEHEGPALSAIRRKLTENGEPITHPVLQKNDRLAAGNAAVQARNEARLGRDTLLRELQPRLIAQAELITLSEQMGHDNAVGRPWLKSDQQRHRQLVHEAGDTVALRKVLAGLPPETLLHLSEHHRIVVHLIGREAYQQKMKSSLVLALTR